MTRPTVEQCVRELRLEPHLEGGYFRETCRAADTRSSAARSPPVSTSPISQWGIEASCSNSSRRRGTRSSDLRCHENIFAFRDCSDTFVTVRKKRKMLTHLARSHADAERWNMWFWRRAGANGRFSAAWLMLGDLLKIRGKSGRLPRLRRSVQNFQRA